MIALLFFILSWIIIPIFLYLVYLCPPLIVIGIIAVIFFLSTGDQDAGMY